MGADFRKLSRDSGSRTGGRLRLQASRARVFEKALRDTARDIRDKTRECIYASSLDKAKELNDKLRKQYAHFNDLVANVLPELY